MNFFPELSEIVCELSSSNSLWSGHFVAFKIKKRHDTKISNTTYKDDEYIRIPLAAPTIPLFLLVGSEDMQCCQTLKGATLAKRNILYNVQGKMFLLPVN